MCLHWLKQQKNYRIWVLFLNKKKHQIDSLEVYFVTGDNYRCVMYNVPILRIFVSNIYIYFFIFHICIVSFFSFLLFFSSIAYKRIQAHKYQICNSLYIIFFYQLLITLTVVTIKSYNTQYYTNIYNWKKARLSLRKIFFLFFLRHMSSSFCLRIYFYSFFFFWKILCI